MCFVLQGWLNEHCVMSWEFARQDEWLMLYTWLHNISVLHLTPATFRVPLFEKIMPFKLDQTRRSFCTLWIQKIQHAPSERAFSNCIKQNTPRQFRSVGMILLRVSWFVLLSVFDYSLLVLACVRLKELTGCFLSIFIGVGVFRVSFFKTCKNLQAWLARIWLISLFVIMLWIYKFFFTLMIFWNCTRNDNFSGQCGFRKTRTPAQIYLQKKKASSIRH